jgi:hypothetical protein
LPKVPKGSLRYIVRQQLMRACENDVAAKEVADRLDGKSVRGSDDENPAMQIVEIRLVMVDASGAAIEQPKTIEGEKPSEVKALPAADPEPGQTQARPAEEA